MKRVHHLFVLAVTLNCVALASGQQPPPMPQNLEVKANENAAEKVRSDLATLLDRTLIDVSESLIADNGLGIDLAPPEAALRAQLSLGTDSGLVVTAAPEGSLGAKAGLKVHDVVIQFGDQKLGQIEKLKEWLDASDGKPVTLKVLRSGRLVEVQVTPKKPESGKVRLLLSDSDMLAHVDLAASQSYRIGISLSEADDALRSQLRLASGEGLVVTDVVEDSAAAAAGIQANDVLIVLDGKRLTTVEAINGQVQQIKDRSVELRLLRGGKEMAIQVAPRKTQEAAFTIGRSDFGTCRAARSATPSLSTTPRPRT